MASVDRKNAQRDIFTASYIPDIGLLLANLLILALSGGDGRIFIISLVANILFRYAVLSVLVFGDRYLPGFCDRPLVRRLIRDPDEGGAYTGGGAETPIFGHLIFLFLFAFGPLIGIFRFFETIPFADNLWLAVAAVAAAEIRDILVGRVIYFRPGAGQGKNAQWNFTQALVLVLTMILMWGVAFFGPLLLLLPAWLFSLDLSVLMTKEVLLWLVSIWILGAFHGLLFLHARYPHDPDTTASRENS
jgi:hypothetical protein